MSAPINIRKAKKEDVNFILAHWLKSYKSSSPVTKFIKDKVFFDRHQKILFRLLSKPETEVVLAVDKEDEDVIYGFLAYEPKIVHFIYIKPDFRKMGIAKTLIGSQAIDLNNCQCSHVTWDLVDLWKERKVSLHFNPYILQGEP